MTNGIFSSAVAGTPAVEASGTNAAEGISASSDTGAGVSGTSASGNGGMFGSWGGAAAAAAAWTPAGNGVLGVVGPGAPPDLPVGGVVGVNQAPALTIPNQGPLPGGPGVFGTSISGSGVCVMPMLPLAVCSPGLLSWLQVRISFVVCPVRFDR